MNLERYVYFSNKDFLEYEFYSDGPKGKIKKIVRFTKIPGQKPIVYNLGFGDVGDGTSVIDDGIVSNNSDRDKVLATVANTIIDFTNHYGNHYIYASGSTPSRTRLYQMGVAKLWPEIGMDFDIYGLIDDIWYPFEKNTRYDAFLVKRK